MNALQSEATFSPDRVFRYDLWRRWIGGTGYAMFVGLNPSTADEVQDDPTVRRCIAFAKSWGYAALCMTNAFAFRATDPADMMAAADPVGPENDHFLLARAKDAGVVVAAWGNTGVFLGRDRAVRALLPGLSCLRLTGQGQPWHPLYLPGSLRPVRWAPAVA